MVVVRTKGWSLAVSKEREASERRVGRRGGETVRIVRRTNENEAERKSGKKIGMSQVSERCSNDTTKGGTEFIQFLISGKNVTSTYEDAYIFHKCR